MAIKQNKDILKGHIGRCVLWFPNNVKNASFSHYQERNDYSIFFSTGAVDNYSFCKVTEPNPPPRTVNEFPETE